MEPLRSRWRSGAVGGAVLGLAGLLAALAVVFSHASGTRRATDEAVAAQQMEATLGSLATFRATLGQAYLVAESSPEAVVIPVLLDDARALLDLLQDRFDEARTVVAGHGVDPGPDPDGMLQASSALLGALESGDPAAAETLAAAAADALDALTADLATRRTELVRSITETGSQAGRVATASRFMVALGLPGLTLLSWAVFAGKRRRRRELAAALERERDLNRSKDQMIANISHELRTPLTSIYAAGRTLLDMEPADPGLSRELHGVVVEQSGELTRMVEDLLVSAQADADRLSLALQEV